MWPLTKSYPSLPHHQKNTKETTFLEMDPGSPYIPHRFQLRQRHGARLEHCGASNVPRFELRATWLGQSTVSMLSDEHVKWQRPWEAPIGAGAEKNLVGEISRWKEGGKVPKKWGMLCGWLFSLFFVGVQVLLFDMFGIFSKHRGQAKPSTRWYVSFFGGLGPGK